MVVFRRFPQTAGRSGEDRLMGKGVLLVKQEMLERTYWTGQGSSLSFEMNFWLVPVPVPFSLGLLLGLPAQTTFLSLQLPQPNTAAKLKHPQPACSGLQPHASSQGPLDEHQSSKETSLDRLIPT